MIRQCSYGQVVDGLYLNVTWALFSPLLNVLISFFKLQRMIFIGDFAILALDVKMWIMLIL
jgi:hypothetical protein